MRKTFGAFTLLTGGIINGVEKQTIDHIFCSPDIEKQSLVGINNFNGNVKLSDHFGIFASLKRKENTANKS